MCGAHREAGTGDTHTPSGLSPGAGRTGQQQEGFIRRLLGKAAQGRGRCTVGS